MENTVELSEDPGAASRPVIKARRAWIAGVLSLLVPGLGQLYAGRPKRALVEYGCFTGLLVVFLASGAVKTFAGLIVFLVASLGFLLWAIWDAIHIARRNRDHVLQPFNRWYWYVAFWLANLLIAPQILALSPVRAFQIPSGSMEPAIRVGDHLYADMKYYRSAKPARGDLVIFTSVKNPANLLVERVIGLEGETLEIRNKTVFINGQRIADPWGRHDDSAIYPPIAARRAGDNTGPLQVPPGMVFVLGDNRDNSYDSRFYGPVPVGSLRGRPLYLYWARDRSRIGRALR